MTKRIIAILLSSIIFLSGCGDKPKSQKDCIVEYKFKYDGKCEHLHNIPDDEQVDVIVEVAREIAKEQNMSELEALKGVMQILSK